MKRWLLLPLGLGMAAAAAWTLISGLPALEAGGSGAPSSGSERPGSRLGPERASQAGDVGEEIDEESRRRLQQILREAGREETR